MAFLRILRGNFEMQRQVVTIDLPKYKKKVDRFGCDLAIKHCAVNDAEFDPASWWGLFGGTTPHLTKIAMRIFSLTNGIEEYPETVNEALATDDIEAPRESLRMWELSDEDFESESEEEVLEEDEYESDGVQIMEVCGED
ncbi:unnamed protein product [Lactuca saligna]|uniref:HAT C-terminal dimerisation domain-containing protein n=1 Tax=Lactuca saligna TaxID=75948 RepID=A0AA35Z7Q4_LACSI|nr:unnamed protein product [Lactuca saligna]